MKKAVLLGASGLVGGHCLSLLLSNPDYDQVTALVRRPLHLPAQHPGLTKLKQQAVDFEHLDAVSSFLKGDHVFICLGTTIKNAGSQEAFYRVDLTYPVQVARLAASQGARKLLMVSAVGANADSRIFYSRVKGEAEAAVASSGVPEVHIFRPSFLLGERPQSRPLEKLALRLLAPLSPWMIGPAAHYRPVDGSTVAMRMVENAIAPDRLGTFIHENESLGST